MTGMVRRGTELPAFLFGRIWTLHIAGAGDAPIGKIAFLAGGRLFDESQHLGEAWRVTDEAVELLGSDGGLVVAFEAFLPRSASGIAVRGRSGLLGPLGVQGPFEGIIEADRPFGGGAHPNETTGGSSSAPSGEASAPQGGPMDATPGAEAPQLDSVVLTPRQTEPGFPLDGVVSRYGESYNLDEVATFAAAITSSDYARNCMTGCAKLPDGESFLRAVALASLAPGLWLEFGVYSGRTLAVIAGARPDIKIYGFDSFEGLPEDWRDAYGRGTFATQALPPTPENGELVVGRFDATLPGFVSAHAGQPVSFIHVDCDLYSSTRVIFEHLRPMLRPGTVIAFDEYFNYPGWQQHEFRAFQEFVREAGIRYEYFAYVPSHQQVAVRIIEVGAGRH